jgi:hypothetical protein
MADKKIQLKRNNASTIDNLFPVARISDMVESDGTTSFLDSGKIRSSYLPSYVIGGLRFYATQSLATSTSLATIFSSLVGFSTTAADVALKIGSYVVVTTGGELTTTDATIGSVAGYQLNAPGDEGDSTTPITLEAGDWIVFRGEQRTGSGGTLELYYFFDIINNTYQDATNTNKGVVTISVATDTASMNGSGKVITEDVLFDVIGTAANKIAAGDHLHTGVYEPKNAGLTDLAALLTAGTAGFVRVNGVNDASLDTNSYLNASTTSTQSGYFGNIHLQDDTTPSHYLGITATSNLTANRTLSLTTGDADRTLSMGGNITTAGNLTTSTGNVSITAQAAGSTLSLPSTLTFGAVTANGILYGSSADNVGMIASTTIGRNTLTIPDIAAISFARYNADETISMLDAATFRTAIGAGTSSTTGTVTSVATSGAITGGTITTTGTISHSTADGDKHVPATSTTNDRKFLVAGSTAGTFAWEAFPRTFYDTTVGTISGDIIFDEVA